ncbi:MAG: phage holin family protein [Actinomycetia bacterium]|nr:phage holin family protein [Actinomycetes bacterium]
MSDAETTTRRPWTPPPEPSGPGTQLNEFKDMVVAYTRQETVDPLKTLGRHLGFGIGGALLIGAGWIFGLLALLRGLQRINFFNQAGEVGGGPWGWLPYLIVTVVGIAVAGMYGRLVMLRMNENGVGK